MNRQLLNDPAAYKAFIEKIPMGRWGELHDIAGAALFLASDAASFVTGGALFVDGGRTAPEMRGPKTHVFFYLHNGLLTHNSPLKPTPIFPPVSFRRSG